MANIIAIIIKISNLVHEVTNFEYGVPTPNGVIKMDDATYRSLSAAQFWAAKCGVCHDYAAGILYRLVQWGFKAVSQIKGDNECTVVYTHYLLTKEDRSRDNYHAIPIFTFQGKIYALEASWKDERMLGLHEFSSFEELVKFFETASRSVLAEYAHCGYGMGSAFTAWTTMPHFEGGLTKAELVAH